MSFEIRKIHLDNMASSSDESDTYEFEPIPKKPKYDFHSCEETINFPQTQSRQGNTTWCKCGNCRVMESEEESVCCHDDVPEDYLQGKGCIIDNENFSAVCLQREVLKTVLYMLNNMRGDKINIKNESLRYAGYRQFTWWVHNHLGKGV